MKRKPKTYKAAVEHMMTTSEIDGRFVLTGDAKYIQSVSIELRVRFMPGSDMARFRKRFEELCKEEEINIGPYSINAY